MKCVLLPISLFILLVVSCKESSKRFNAIPQRLTGITFSNQLEPSVELNILTYLYYYNGAGVSAADYNNDGWVDLYFIGNQSSDRLYLNSGGLKFNDVTSEIGVSNDDGWSTGVSHVDINSDGWMDIYVCKVGDYKSIKGRNLLFLNKGVNKEGVPIFEERAADYGLAISAFSTQSAFFDYDLDGDLDMFLLNHSVHPNRSYGKGVKRNEIDSLSGDRLYENIDGFFHDVSLRAGIHQGSIGYGLGVSISDLNSDGYPDIYIGNDFFENDYLYMNQRNGTFKDVISLDATMLGHTTHYSMGNTTTDLNNDGNVDIISLDMLPQDLETYKSSGTEDPFSVYSYYLKNGYQPQYMQNTLHVNRADGKFSEVAFLTGIAATEWSWGVLASDFDMDGTKDLYITNGIKGATNDMDFISFVAQEQIQNQINQEDQGILEFTTRLPEKKLVNYAYKGSKDLLFKDVTQDWFEVNPTFSSGSTAVDLDNDGDLDIVVNNMDATASIYENKSEEDGKNYLKIDFVGSEQNPRGIGAKVFIYVGDQLILEEQFINRSYLSASPHTLTIGVDKAVRVDSLLVVWPGGSFQRLQALKTNQLVKLELAEAKGDFYSGRRKVGSLLENTEHSIPFTHQEEATLEFNREPLIPFGKANEGPKASVGDVNKDGLLDLFIGGAKWQSAVLLIQDQEGQFGVIQEELFQKHAKNEDTDNLFLDIDLDNDLDLVVVSGGNEFKSGDPLRPRLYLNENGFFTLNESFLEGVEVNASSLGTLDLENDGDPDLIIGSNTIPGEFGEIATNYILKNEKGQFVDVTETLSSSFKNVGLIEDFTTLDVDGNGYSDIVTAGYWMPITIYYNDGLTLREELVEESYGWWNSIQCADFDKDGDLDLVAGNWGLNSRLSASKDLPITLYRNDFDANGKTDPIVTYYYREKETTLASKDELVKQLPYLNKTFLSYQRFAEASLESLLSKEKLDQSKKAIVNELATCYFENLGNNIFAKHPLPLSAQFSSVHDITLDDFNSDGFVDLLLVGNTYEISTQLGRLDASHGVLLLNDQRGFFLEESKQGFSVDGPARGVEKITINDKEHFLVTINGGQPVVLKKKEK